MRGDDVVVEKRAWVTEEGRLPREVVTEQQHDSDTVLKERVSVKSAGEARGAMPAGQQSRTTQGQNRR